MTSFQIKPQSFYRLIFEQSLKVTKKLKIWAIFFGLLVSLKGYSQPEPVTLHDLFDNIEKQESIFTLPDLDDTLTVGFIDLKALKNGEIYFNFNVPTYDSGRYSYPDPNWRDQVARMTPHGPVYEPLHAPNIGGKILLPNVLKVNFRFEIRNWNNSPTSELTIILGNEKPQTVKQGTPEIIFLDVKEVNPKLSISVNGAVDSKGKNLPYLRVLGLIPFKTEREKVAAGGITFPVIPISLIYAPVADAQKLNTTSLSESTSFGNITTVSFTTQNSAKRPYPTNFESTKNMQEFLNETSHILSQIPIPVTQIIAKAFSGISSDLGSADASETISKSESNQKSLNIVASKNIEHTVFARDGGPGEGDVFIYYRDAKVFWYTEDGITKTTFLGGIISKASAGTLKEALLRLSTQPPGKKDDSIHLDAKSINALLELDPFAKGGANPVLDSRRFKLIPDGRWDLTPRTGNTIYSSSYKLTSTDIKTSTTTVTDVEDDKEGRLAKFGLGVSDTKTVQAQIIQSNSSQNSVENNYTQKFTLYGNAHDYYSVQVYFDVVFGAFAICDVTNENTSTTIAGVLKNNDDKAIPNSIVTLKTATNTFSTQTDSAGNFNFHLPKIKNTLLKLSSDAAETRLNFIGKPIKNITLKPD